MFGQIDEIKNLAFKYSKQELGRMVQMGMVDPQKAMMAGMMRSRMETEDAKPPTTTVAQDVLGLAPQMQQPAQPQQMGMPQAPAPQAPTQMAATGGITSLPVHEQDYAGGGIVAFADGGNTEDGYEYVFDPASGTYKQVGAPKETVAPVDTRQHLGNVGLGIFGSEGIDLMTGLPKGNMRDPVLGFAEGGVTHFDSGGFNFPQGSLLGMYQKYRSEQPSAGAEASMALEELDARIAETPPGPTRDKLIANRELYGQAPGSFIAQAKKANSQIFPTGLAATPVGQQAQVQQASTSGVDTITNPFDTGVAAAPAAPGAPAAKAPPAPVGAGGGPRLPALNRPSGKIDVQDYTAATPKSIDEILAEQQEVYKKQGIEDPYKGLTEKTEKKREELGGRKEQAKGEFLMNLGLGLTQSARGQEVAGLGKGAMKGMADYKDAMKDVRAAEEKLDDRLDAYKLAEYQAKKTGTDAAIAKRDSMLEKVDAAKNKTIEAKNAAAAKGEEIKAHVYGYELQAQTQKEVANIHANSQKEMNTLVKQGQLDAKIAQVLLTSEKNFMDANAMSYVGKPQELARDAREHAMEAARAYLPGSAAAQSAPAPAPAPTADLYKNKYGITPTKG